MKYYCKIYLVEMASIIHFLIPKNENHYYLKLVFSKNSCFCFPKLFKNTGFDSPKSKIEILLLQ